MTPQRPIPDEIWEKHFTLPDQRYDGSKFEDLVAALLRNLYPVEWKPTPRSHDQSRDFVAFDSEGELWAECKSYKKNLPMHVLSPTLVMALVNRVKGVLIFSRSELNNRAFETLSRYRKATAKTIQVFDGETLDEQIVKYTDLFRSYFPGESPVQHENTRRVGSWIYYNLNPLIVTGHHQPSEPVCEEDSKQVKINLHDVFGIAVVLKNSDPETCRIEVSVQPKQIPACLEILGENKVDLKWQFDLPPGGVEVCTIYFRAIDAAKNEQLPTIKVRANSEDVFHSTSTIEVTALYRSKLIGRSANQGLTKFAEAIEHKRRALAFCLVGPSGVGKSRLLREFGRSAVENGATVQLFDTEQQRSSSGDTFIRQFLANLTDLPPFDIEWDGAKIEHIRNATTASRKDIKLLDYIYDKSKSISPNDLASLVLRVAGKRRVCWLIDNAQNLTSELITFFEALLEQLENATRPFWLILSFNSDFLVSGNRWGALVKDLELASRSDDGLTRYHKLAEFSRQDAERFLEATLTGLTDSNEVIHYKNTLDFFFRFVEPRPLHIWVTLRYLEDKGALVVRSDRLAVVNPEVFRQRIAELPSQLEQVLDERLNILLRRSADSELDETSIMSTFEIMWILGSASKSQLQSFGASIQCVEFLAETGFLEWESSGLYRFYHFKVLLFVHNKNLFNESSSEGYLDRIHDQDMERQLFQPVLILAEIVGMIPTRIGELCLDEFVVHGAGLPYGAQFCRILRDWLVESKKPPEKYIRGLMQVAQWHSEHVGYSDGVQSYRVSFRSLHVSELVRPAEVAFVKLLHAMSNCLPAVGEDEESLEVVNAALERLETRRKKGSSQDNLVHIKGHLLNRRMAIHKAVGIYDAAIEDGHLALETARQADDLELMILNSFDIGRVYLEAKGDRETFLTWWRKGVAQFEQITELKDAQIFTRTAYVRAMLSNIAGETSEARKIADEGIAYAQATRGHFWGIRLYEAALCAHLLEGSLGNEVDVTLAQLMDWWSTFGVRRSAWRVYYLKAKIQFERKQFEWAVGSFKETLESLAETANTANKAWRKRELYLDIAFCLALSQRSPAIHSGLLPVNPRLNGEFVDVLEMGRKDLSSAFSEHIERNFLKNSKRSICLPLV